MKKIYMCLLVFAGLVLFVCGCKSAEDKSTEGMKKTEESMETVTLKWGLFTANSDFMAQTQKQINGELKRRGLPYAIEFLSLGGSFNGDYEEYVKDYIVNVTAEDCDIVECGGMEGNCYDVHEMMINAEVLASWNDWLENQEEGRRLREAYPEHVWREIACDGQVYGIPTVNTDFQYYGVFNRDFADKYQVKMEKISAFALEESLQRAMEGEKKEGNDSFVPLASWPFFLRGKYEFSRCELIAINTEGGRLCAESILNNEEFIGQMERLNRWRAEGLFVYNPTAAQLTEGNFLLAGITSYSEAAAESQCRSLYAIPEDVRLKAVVVPEFREWLTSNGQYVRNRAGVMEKSAHQEEAFALLSAIYSEADLSNLLVYGMEGEDYNIDKGKVVRAGENGKISAREMGFGNSFLTLPDLFDSEAKNTELWEAVEHLGLPAQHGKTIYDEELLKKISAINSMVMGERFYSALGGNSENWESDLERLRKRAGELGLDEVVEEMNRRFQEAEE